MKWKFYSLAFVAGMSILTACSSDDNNDNDGNGGNDDADNSGTLQYIRLEYLSLIHIL